MKNIKHNNIKHNNIKHNNIKNNNIKQNNYKIIIIIIVCILIIIGIGIGLYFYLKNDTSTVNKNTTENKNATGNIVRDVQILSGLSIISNLKKNQQCRNTSCIKVGQNININDIFTSPNNNITIQSLNPYLFQLFQEEKYFNNSGIYAREKIAQEELDINSAHALSIYNKYSKVSQYLNLRNNYFKLSSNGFLMDNDLIKIYGIKCVIKDKTYYCDLSYVNTLKFVLLFDNNGSIIGTITLDDYKYLDKNKNTTVYFITNISYIMLTEYSLLVFDENNNFIGILTI
jgi:hypothetical protein